MAQNLKILHICFLKDWRGGEQQAVYLFEELLKRKCNQWILCSEETAMETYCEDNGIPYYSLQKGFLKNYKNAKQLKIICERHFIDIIHAHDSKAHTLAYVSGLLGNKTPIIVSRRVDFPIGKTKFSKNKYNFPGIRKIICVSNKIKEVLLPDIDDPSKLEVIYSGIDISRFLNTTSKGILRKEYRIPKEIPIIGNIAAIAPHKDYYTFVNTVEILIQRGIKAKFFIIGDGPLRKEIEDYIAEKQLNDHIILTGFRTDIPEILPELDVFLFTSETEGLGTSILDAFACSVPVVATRAGGIPEIIEHNKSGLLSEIKDADQLAQNVISILENNQLAKNLKLVAKEQVQMFTKEKMGELTFELYKRMYFLGN